MAQQDAFALSRSNLNGFLFADIGIEANGMPLSVISALAREGFDPWQEAGRLADLPRLAAIGGLARLIAAVPASPWPLPDATAIAAGLVTLLPRHQDRPGAGPAIVSSAGSAGAGMRSQGTVVIAALLAITTLFGLAAFVAQLPAHPAASSPAPIVPLAPVPAIPTGD